MKTTLPLTLALGAAALVSAQVARQTSNPTPNTVEVTDLEWGPLNPARGNKGPKAANLWSDRTGKDPSGFLVEFADGFSSPPHIHNVTYRGVVISGLVHNDDPEAEPMWMPPGSFWTQPAGQVHITAAKGKSLAYIEIDQGPYLVLPKDEAFDKGERPVNLDATNIVWQDRSTTNWIDKSANDAAVAFLWGEPKKDQLNGTFVKLPAGFSGTLQSEGAIVRAVVVKGQPTLKSPTETEPQAMQPGAYFGSDGAAEFGILDKTDAESLIYIRSQGKFRILGSIPTP